MHHVVSKELLKKFKERNKDLLPAHLDPGMWEVVNLINQHPEMATAWSCSGHINPRDVECLGYILLASSDETLPNRLYDLFLDDHYEEFVKTGLVHNLNLQKAVMVLPWIKRFSLKNNNTENFYKAWMLRWEINKSYGVDYWLSRLAKVLRKI